MISISAYPPGIPIPVSNTNHKKSEGRCWMDLTVTVDSGTKGRWPTVKVIRDRYSSSLNLDVKFHVWLIDPWMVHIEMTEEEGWTAQEVLSLPDWFMIGGTFEEDALACGYSEEFLKYTMVYGTVFASSRNILIRDTFEG